MTHATPHVDDADNCLCDCSACVSEWRPMSFGGARRYCICPDCTGSDCPPWRTDQELHNLVSKAAL